MTHFSDLGRKTHTWMGAAGKTGDPPYGLNGATLGLPMESKSLPWGRWYVSGMQGARKHKYGSQMYAHGHSYVLTSQVRVDKYLGLSMRVGTCRCLCPHACGWGRKGPTMAISLRLLRPSRPPRAGGPSTTAEGGGRPWVRCRAASWGGRWWSRSPPAPAGVTPECVEGHRPSGAMAVNKDDTVRL